MNIPRSEHPKPQFQRSNWMNLNGEWDFCFDNGRSGIARKFYENSDAFDKKITVPFCVESSLSGIGHKDFMYGVWYRRTFDISEDKTALRTVLHIGAADFKTYVYVNGKIAGEHTGGYVSFSFDISDFIEKGENTVVIYCEDDTRNPLIPRGKQSEEYYSHGCDYTRTTGIWQTVWLEFTEKQYIKHCKYYPDYRKSTLTIVGDVSGSGDLSVKALYDGREVGFCEIADCSGNFCLTINLSETHLWDVGSGRLYDLELKFGNDTVKSYFGLRNIWFDGYKFMLNGKSVFQRLILDQGFYPDGIYTAPSDEALLNDIKMSQACGFNGARLHEKVFEERFLYHCDKEGYLVWGEYANWGLDHTRADAIYTFLPEWFSEIDRDFNHPAIIGWCPFNETWDINGLKQYDELLRMVYTATKSADKTRPCIDTSGNFHVETDIFDLHDYEQNVDEFKKNNDVIIETGIPNDRFSDRQEYKNGLPVFISEYGGIKWSPVSGNSREVSWGYGDAPKTEEEFKARYKGLTDALLDNPCFFGFCYTQLTDVEQEQNGVYTYDRKEKFPSEFFYKVNSRKAAIEE
ncbi:MAG: beta-galactosidase [Clostridia bacterium]|nr:beta-galactosidase [Clostridia bacterium]